MIGGAYLCFEGVEKIAHSFFAHANDKIEHEDNLIQALNDDSNSDLVELEQDKIKGAIRTDFVLSAEIIVIALGTVKDVAFLSQVAVVSTIAIVMTIGVYGLVAGIVKLDDAGLALILSKTKSTWAKIKRKLGHAILWFAPVLMKSLSVIGTAAMFLVGGGILVHGIPQSHDLIHHLQEPLHAMPYLGASLAFTLPFVMNVLLGIVAGAIVLSIVTLTNRFKLKMMTK